MEPKVLSVIYEINAQHYTAGRFSIPKRVVEFMGVGPGGPVHLLVQDASGANLYEGVTHLVSGDEIYGPEIRAHIKAGERIRVTVSLPEERPAQ